MNDSPPNVNSDKESSSNFRSTLESQIEQGAILKLLDGTVRRGFIYAVDPEIPCVLLLVKSKDSEIWGVSAVFFDGIADCVAEDLLPHTFQIAVGACPILKKLVDPTFAADQIARRREEAIAALKKNGLQVSIEGDELLVLGGLARIRRPYGPEDCQTANSLVYQKLATILPRL